ncbi:hypothetical protein ABW22_15840 [Thiobacillus denitrificans]|uniref:Uncharacterized protein n=1 Tax=Thiobacillus denitrificans TaxID=36861 RepID=A0A106BHL1_THIDE|nr:hypothetical protein ABW22_15840 [Thiobacillus denitrificans]
MVDGNKVVDVLFSIQMLVVAFAAFIVETDYAFSIQHINQAVLESVVAGWNGTGQLPYSHFYQPTIGQALAMLLEQFCLHVGIVDNKLSEVKQQFVQPRERFFCSALPVSISAFPCRNAIEGCGSRLISRPGAEPSLDSDKHAALRSDLEQLWSAHNQASEG